MVKQMISLAIDDARMLEELNRYKEAEHQRQLEFVKMQDELDSAIRALRRTQELANDFADERDKLQERLTAEQHAHSCEVAAIKLELEKALSICAGWLAQYAMPGCLDAEKADIVAKAKQQAKENKA